MILIGSVGKKNVSVEIEIRSRAIENRTFAVYFSPQRSLMSSDPKNSKKLRTSYHVANAIEERIVLRDPRDSKKRRSSDSKAAEAGDRGAHQEAMQKLAEASRRERASAVGTGALEAEDSRVRAKRRADESRPRAKAFEHDETTPVVVDPRALSEAAIASVRESEVPLRPLSRSFEHSPHTAVTAPAEPRPPEHVAVPKAERIHSEIDALDGGSEPKPPPLPSTGKNARSGEKPLPERISTDIDAVGTASIRAPIPSGARVRIQAALKELSLAGPGDEEPGVRALMQTDARIALLEIELRFPGLLWFHRAAPHRKLPQGRDIGPLGAALVAFGSRAVSTVQGLIASPNADVRYYAILVAHDLISTCSTRECSAMVQVLGERLFDEDLGVRDAALHALLPCELELLKPLVERLVQISGEGDFDRTMASLRALGVLRTLHGIPPAIAALSHKDDRVQLAAQRVLRLLTAADNGSSQRKWQKWWRKNTGVHRAKLLLLGLRSRDASLREVAIRELDRLIDNLPDFDPHDSRKNRKVALANIETAVAHYLSE